VIYNRTLSAAEILGASSELQKRYSILARTCDAPNPHATLDCVALRRSCVKGAWPRGCGLNATEATKLESFLEAAAAQPDTKASVPYAMAETARDFTNAFEARCQGLSNGTIPAMASQTVAEKSLADLLSAAGNWYEGLSNAIANRYAHSEEPVATAVVAAWTKAVYE
jgi:hypothetical protein